MISVIIPNWNGQRLLPGCLNALRLQTATDFEVLVVDDGSTDASVEIVRQRYPEVRVVEMPANRGFAAAANGGIVAAKGEIVALLNNDAEPVPEWLEELGAAFETYPWASMVACKIMLYDRRTVFHSAGDFYRLNGVPGSRGVWEEDRGQYAVAEEVFGPCAAAAGYRRAMLEQLAGSGQVFDEDLVMYCEDVDLNLRARSAGFRCVYAPRALVYHRLSATGGGPLASYQVGRNLLAVALKNLPAGTWRRFGTAVVASQVRLAIESIRHVREPAARARLAGQWAGLRMAPRFWAKRRALAARATVSGVRLEQMLQSEGVSTPSESGGCGEGKA